MLTGFFHRQPVIGALILQGVSEIGEPVLLVNGENPSRCAGFPADPGQPIDKDHLELFHIESFRADFALANNALPFAGLTTGANPPDFLAEIEDRKVAIDCVALANTHRRRSYHLMNSLKVRLAGDAAHRDFSGIAGCVVSIWFGPQMQDLPPRQQDDTLIGPLLDALETCSVDYEQVGKLNAEIAAQGFPEVMPPLVETRTLPDGAAGLVVNVLTGPIEGLRFSTGLPFEVQLSRQADTTGSQAVEELQRLVSSHDKPEIEYLVVTAGGPDRLGVCYPAEEALAGFLAELDSCPIVAEYVSTVYLHMWSSRRVVHLPVRRPGIVDI